MASPASSRGTQLLSNLTSVTKRISAASSASSHKKQVRLVAVSKLKPASDVLSLYSPTPQQQATTTTPDRQLHFGENYLQELLEKSRTLPPEIRWHFIGGLQSNKCVTLARDVRGLWAVESVDSEKKAGLLNRGWGERNIPDTIADREAEEGRLLRIYVQVNTSGEESKSGVEPAEAVKLCRYIREKCPRLKLQGLMTIGAIARSKATTLETENEDFVCLRETRDSVVKDMGLEGEGGLELSMGMSEDFEKAIDMGSDQVRVGSTIFGARPPKGQTQAAS
ncbi:hypothetical protein FQN54_002259 [Arachnomyces sp. PD_36]|nr:hypothetical protein FQN54_002259 [Arachnomyces sp. PD_36]